VEHAVAHSVVAAASTEQLQNNQTCSATNAGTKALPTLPIRMHVAQVVSEASDAGARGILHHCHTPRLVPQVCEILTGDKNAKLRKHCSGFLLQVSCLYSHRSLLAVAVPTQAQTSQQTVLVALCLWRDIPGPALTLWVWLCSLLLQVLEGWEPQEYAHYFDQVEAALTAAVQDALGETRTNGRTAFAAYAAAMPDRASALMRRFDSGLQQKLHEAVVAYGKGHTGESQWSSLAVGCRPMQPWAAVWNQHHRNPPA
jgi:CLIP-associating protein 1/2